MFPQLFHRPSVKDEKEQSGVSRTEWELTLARFDRLESELKGIRLEWNDVYDKVAHLYDRTRKRITALRKAEDRSSATNGAEGDPEHTQPQTHADLMNMARGRGMVK